MKNLPRLFIDRELSEGTEIFLDPAQLHYLKDVMRSGRFLAFCDGIEYQCMMENEKWMIRDKTGHADPSGKWICYFAPIKRIENFISGIVQMGAGILQPVITERTIARRVNPERMRKIAIEAAEQSGRNSVPPILSPISFANMSKNGVIYGDERKLEFDKSVISIFDSHFSIFIGPEGGFTPAEFNALDSGGAIGVGLGPAILRAEVAAIALAAKISVYC